MEQKSEEMNPPNYHQLTPEQQIQLQQLQLQQSQQLQYPPYYDPNQPPQMNYPFQQPYPPTQQPLGLSPSLTSLHPSMTSSTTPSVAATTTSHTLPRGNLSLKERVAFDNLLAHHANLRRAVPAVSSWNDNASHGTLARNHVAAVNRNLALKRAEIARQNSQMVVKITETVIKGHSPYNAAILAKSTPNFTHRSLNASRRKKEQERIWKANVELTKRLITKKPEVGAREEWNKHALMHERARSNISRFIEVPSSALHQHQQSQQPTIAVPVSGLPPGFTPESFAEAMQQLALQQQAVQSHPHLMQPSPPTQPRGTASAGNSGVGGPLQPIPDADERSARLTKKMIAMEKAKFGPSTNTERLLRPLRKRSSQQQLLQQQQQQQLLLQQYYQQQQQYPQYPASYLPPQHPATSSRHDSPHHSAKSSIHQLPPGTILSEPQPTSIDAPSSATSSSSPIMHSDPNLNPSDPTVATITLPILITPQPEPELVLRKSGRTNSHGSTTSTTGPTVSSAASATHSTTTATHLNEEKSG